MAERERKGKKGAGSSAGSGDGLSGPEKLTKGSRSLMRRETPREELT